MGYSVAIVGPHAPIGGVSTHIARLRALVDSQDACSTEMYSTALAGKGFVTRTMWFLRVILRAREDILHYHSTDWRGLLALHLGPRRGRRLLVSHHGERLVLGLPNFGRSKRRLIEMALRGADGHVVCNERIWSALVGAGVRPEAIALVPAFIPPPSWDTDAESLPQATRDFCAEHDPVMCLISRVNRWEGNCLYGDDMAIAALESLRSRYPDIGLVYRCHDVVDEDTLAGLLEVAGKLGIEDRIHLLREPLDDMNAVLAQSSVLLRPTNTDGDSLIVREALALGVPVVCSDVVRRPEGVLLFPTRDQERFEARVVEAIVGSGGADAGARPTIEQANYGRRILDVYDRLMSGSSLEDIRES